MTSGPVRRAVVFVLRRCGRIFAFFSFSLGSFQLGCEASGPSSDSGAPLVATEGAGPGAVIAPPPAVETSPPAAPSGETESSAAAEEPSRELSWTFPRGPFGPTDVAISIPASRGSGERFPVLVAFHGRGESVKGSRSGARGWLDDYRLTRAIERLGAPPLRSEDFESFVSDARLGRFNTSLGERPYAGLIVVCPFLPDVLKGAKAFEEAGPLADFVVDVLLPRVYAKTPALGTPATTGIDGVSLGGRASLLVGFTRPLAFGSVGALQAALDPKELARFSRLAASAVAQNPALRLRLLTSDEDYFRKENQRLSVLLERAGVAHQLLKVVGTHSYRFNRGPGSFEMLVFHDRVLRGEGPL